jgi:hypothetical protein
MKIFTLCYFGAFLFVLAVLLLTAALSPSSPVKQLVTSDSLNVFQVTLNNTTVLIVTGCGDPFLMPDPKNPGRIFIKP